jgi:hypothetical protein
MAACPRRNPEFDFPATSWSGIRDAARREFNARLKAKSQPPGKWSVGTNKVDRILGRELCVLGLGGRMRQR